MVVGRRYVSAVLCGPGEKRETDRWRPGQEPEAPRASLGVRPLPPPKVGRVTPRRLGECPGPERDVQPSGKPFASAGGPEAHGGQPER